MRIAIFTDTYPPFVNGVSTSTFNLANTLVANGHEVLVIAPRSTDGKLQISSLISQLKSSRISNLMLFIIKPTLPLVF